MIRSIDIRNFRCYHRLHISDVGRLNVVTGDNGSGKTSALEAIFLPLSTGSEVALRMRQQRGLEGIFAGTVRRIEETLWGDFFNNYDMRKVISLSLEGDADESRSLQIARGRAGMTLPIDLEGSNQPILSAPVTFTWKNAAGQEASVVPQISKGELTFPETGEDMQDFFYIPAMHVISAHENAGRFSELSKINMQDSIVQVFTKEFKNIEDLSIEVSAGSPAIFAKMKGINQKIPLPNVSSGINRIMSILLAIASRPQSIVLVDEIENGIHYTHHRFLWNAVIDLLERNDSQLFVSTHSAECLSALGIALSGKKTDVKLWQTFRDGTAFGIDVIDGKSARLAFSHGDEVR